MMMKTLKTKNLKQTVTLNATPETVYELLMDARKHGKLTGGKVSMSNRVNGKFTVFDGYCKGYNIDLQPGKKIVQAWHFKEDGWPDEHYTECTFLLEKAGKGTKLTFTQKGIPEHKYESLKDGWKEFYWQPLKELFAVK